MQRNRTRFFHRKGIYALSFICSMTVIGSALARADTIHLYASDVGGIDRSGVLSDSESLWHFNPGAGRWFGSSASAANDAKIGFVSALTSAVGHLDDSYQGFFYPAGGTGDASADVTTHVVIASPTLAYGVPIDVRLFAAANINLTVGAPNVDGTVSASDGLSVVGGVQAGNPVTNLSGSSLSQVFGDGRQPYATQSGFVNATTTLILHEFVGDSLSITISVHSATTGSTPTSYGSALPGNFSGRAGVGLSWGMDSTDPAVQLVLPDFNNAPAPGPENGSANAALAYVPVNPIPEPSSLALVIALAASLLGWGMWTRFHPLLTSRAK